MGTFLAGLFWTAVGGAVAATAAFFVRRPETEGRSENNVVVGQVFTIVSGLNAVLLGFVLIGLFDAVSDAREDAYAEAGSLVAVAWTGDSLPEPARTQIRRLSQDYARTVVEQEWPQMRAGQTVDGAGWAQLEQLRVTIARVQATDYAQADRKLEVEKKLWEVYEYRQDRLKSSTKRVSTVMWFTLVATSLLSIALTYFMSGTRPFAYVIVACALAATLTLLLFAIYQFQTPFHGGAQVSSDAFRAALQQLG